MIVFKTVIAELSPTVVDLLPDPLHTDDFSLRDYCKLPHSGAGNVTQFEMCQRTSSNFTSDYAFTENDFLESQKSGEVILPYSKLEEVTLLEELSSIQRKGRYLHERIRNLYPSMQITWSKFETAEVLKVHGSLEGMVDVHGWLEKLVEDLIAESEVTDLKCANLSAVTVAMNQATESFSPIKSLITDNDSNWQKCLKEAEVEDISYEEDGRVENAGITFCNFAKEEVWPDGDVKERTGQSKKSLYSNDHKDDCLHSCDLCNFKTVVFDALKSHQRTVHKNYALSRKQKSPAAKNGPCLPKAVMKRKRHSRKGANTSAENIVWSNSCTDQHIDHTDQSNDHTDQSNDHTDKSNDHKDQSNNYSDLQLRSGNKSVHLQIQFKEDNSNGQTYHAPVTGKKSLQLSTDTDRKTRLMKRWHKPFDQFNEQESPVDSQFVSESNKSQATKFAKQESGFSTSTFACDLCEYMTSKTRNLVFHRARVHGERKLSCPVCSKHFAMRKDLNQHLRFHTERFCCEHCGKTLRSKYALTLHVAVVHEKSQPKPARNYLCNLCGRLCRNKTDYTIHCNKEHLGVHPHACKICGMRFYAKANLKVHLQVHAESRNFVCQECGKTFRQRQGLRVHLNIHMSERPYRCSVCEKTFTQRGALVRHSRTHTTERPYTCKLCTAAFNDCSILRRHMLGIHKMDDTAVLRKTVKEACAKARDIEKSRHKGFCKTETTGFDMANTLIALSQQYHQDMKSDPLLMPNVLQHRNPLGSCALAKMFHTEALPDLSLTDRPVGLKEASASSLISFASPGVITTPTGQISSSTGQLSFQPVMAELVQYISLPYDQLSLGGTTQQSEHLQ